MALLTNLKARNLLLSRGYSVSLHIKANDFWCALMASGCFPSLLVCTPSASFSSFVSKYGFVPEFINIIDILSGYMLLLGALGRI